MAEQWDLYDQDGELQFVVEGTQRHAEAVAELEQDRMNILRAQEGKPPDVKLTVHFRLPSETREPTHGYRTVERAKDNNGKHDT